MRARWASGRVFFGRIAERSRVCCIAERAFGLLVRDECERTSIRGARPVLNGSDRAPRGILQPVRLERALSGWCKDLDAGDRAVASDAVYDEFFRCVLSAVE